MWFIEIVNSSLIILDLDNIMCFSKVMNIRYYKDISKKLRELVSTPIVDKETEDNRNIELK